MKKLFLVFAAVLTFIFSVFTSSGVARAEVPSSYEFQGEWVVHIYVGTRLFDDVVRVAKDQDGRYIGTLTVPGRFTTVLDRVSLVGRQLEFDITADEGDGPFRVRYTATFHNADTFTGFAELIGTGEPLGGFVGQRQTGVQNSSRQRI